MLLNNNAIKTAFLAIAILQFVIPRAAAQEKSDSLDAYAIINKAIEARGGKDFLQSIKTLYTVTKTSINGIEVHWIVKEMFPNKGSFQIAQNNRMIYQSWYDGSNGFEIVNGIKKKQFPEENKDKPYKKNIISELDYINPSLWKIELLGQEKILNDWCYKIKATLVNSSVKYLYYNRTSFLLVQEEKMLDIQKNLVSNFIFLTYKKAGRFNYPNQMKFGENGKLQDALVVDILVNEGVEEKDFK